MRWDVAGNMASDEVVLVFLDAASPVGAKDEGFDLPFHSLRLDLCAHRLALQTCLLL